MATINKKNQGARYTIVSKEKADGATYTPRLLSDFVAEKIIETFKEFPIGHPLRILDPAIGDGQLLISLLEKLGNRPGTDVEVYGFEIDKTALSISSGRIKQSFPNVTIHFEPDSFLDFVLGHFGIDHDSLFASDIPETEAYDIIIANPPYVRTQIMGAHQAQNLRKQFNIAGRVDLYYAFILAIAQVLKPKGIAGIIVSNRFMTTRSGSNIRHALLEQFNLHHIWDLGDSKLFNAAVLPAVLLAEGKNKHKAALPNFTSIYETRQTATTKAATPIEALSQTGIVQLEDGRHFCIQHGKLDIGTIPDSVWRIATKSVDSWLATVNANTWGTFRNIGKIRVGVKTCADKVFIRSDWCDLPQQLRPELLRPLMTHHLARRFKPLKPPNQRQILYPHEMVNGHRCAVDLSRYPHSKNYLESHRITLEDRKYILETGREWYELWVPQDPSAWDKTKLVFRDITEKPTFWIDQDGAIVNGDCYWIICDNPDHTDLLWLAVAVGNSYFIERFYDCCFSNKLYAGRRRFMTQYVEKFPLPNPKSIIGIKIIEKAKEIYSSIPSSHADIIQKQLEQMVWEAFGLPIEEIIR